MPSTLTNMGLTSWTAGSDSFSHVNLQGNWAKLDTHDHTSGNGVQIPTGGIQNLAITAAKIAAGAVTTTQILDGTISTADLSAVLQLYLMPVGSVISTALSAAPSGYLLCDGTAVSRTTYATLFAAISTGYGVGNGSTTFNVPDLRGRVPLGAGTGTATGATAQTRGSQPTAGIGGEQTHQLTGAESGTNGSGSTTTSGAHTHTADDSGGAYFITYNESPSGGAGILYTTGAATRGTVANTGTIGSTHSHPLADRPADARTSLMQPHSVLNFIIKT